MKKEIFKAYDIRGVYPTDINADDVRKIAMAYAQWLKPKKVALGRDVRLSGEELWQAAAEGLTSMGIDVLDIGVVSTDMLYFAVANYDLDGGITISASHNSGEYNGMKMIREKAQSLSIDTGIADIRDLAMANDFTPSKIKGTISELKLLDDYIAKNTGFADKSKIKPLRVFANPNNGASGVAVARIAEYYNLELTKLNFEPDGNFPKGKPDPSQDENRVETEALVKAGDYDFGVTWDADADRCVFFDENGDYILPYYISGLMADYFLGREPGAKMVVDATLYWLPQRLAEKNGGEVIISKTGHSFIKKVMRDNDATFGAEVSAHYYFRDYWYADNGMIPFVIMLEMISQTGKPLSELVSKYQQMVFAIPVTNFTVKNVADSVAMIKGKYSDGKTTEIDGFSSDYSDWRFNVRGSNTEPVLRLNLEATSKELAKEKLAELTEVINGK